MPEMNAWETHPETIAALAQAGLLRWRNEAGTEWRLHPGHRGVAGITAAVLHDWHFEKYDIMPGAVPCTTPFTDWQCVRPADEHIVLCILRDAARVLLVQHGIPFGWRPDWGFWYQFPPNKGVRAVQMRKDVDKRDVAAVLATC